MIVSRETAGWPDVSAEELLAAGAEILGVALEGPVREKLLDYLALLRRWNKKINLIGRAGLNEDVVIHLLDCLAPLAVIPPDPVGLLDIGSGGGLPGLVLKIARPQWPTTLSEPRAKRAAFLRQAVRELKLDGVEVLEGRVERGMGQDRGFGLVTVRAVGDLSNILELAGEVVESGGRLLAYKGPRAGEEMDTAREILKENGFSLEKRQDFALPFLNHERTNLIFLKN